MLHRLGRRVALLLSWRCKTQRRWVGLFVAAALPMIGFHFAGDARAQTRVWVATNDSWTYANNWSPSMLPDSTSDVEIDNGGTATLENAATGQARDVYLGRNLLTDGALAVTTGAQLSSRQAWVGNEGGGVALVHGVASTWTNSSTLTVGNASDLAKHGELNIVEGGSVTAANAVVGSVDNSSGSILVTGSSLIVPNGITIGQRGTGTLHIVLGTVQSGVVRIGQFADPDEEAYGEAVVSGGSWTISNSIFIGEGGAGKLRIEPGSVESSTAYIGRLAGADGDAVVAGGTWEIDGWLVVGEAGTGKLRLENQGLIQTTLSNGTSFIGGSATSDGEVVIDNATWLNSGLLDVRSNGRLAIDSGGDLAVNGVIAGGSDPFFPTVKIDGANLASRATATVANSTWTSAGLFTVGHQGYGKLTIGNGSTLTNTIGVLAFFSSADAEVEVRGGTWKNSGRLTVGAGGKARLTISDGGLVESNTSIIADDASSIATVVVEGFGSRWDNTGTLEVGDTNGPGTQGTLIIRDGGEVMSTGNVTVVGKDVLAGNGKVIGNVSSTATVTPGHIDELSGDSVLGTLNITGNYFQGGGKLQIEVGAHAHDKLDVDGNISMGCSFFFTSCNLEVTFADGFYPAIGQSFDILDWGTATNFGIIPSNSFTPSLPALVGGRVWDLSQLYTNGVISVGGTSTVPGDFNGNGFADAADYVAWRNGLGPTYTPSDYDVWRAHFGQTAGSGLGALVKSSAAVPEPASGMLVLLGLLMASVRYPRASATSRPTRCASGACA